MTGPIKPPGSPPIRTDLPTEMPAAPGEARFRDALEAGRTESTSAPAPAADPVVTARREGRMDAAGAVDALVARALASDAAKGLTPAGRVALEQHLRTQLAEDPAFARLVKDLG